MSVAFAGMVALADRAEREAVEPACLELLVTRPRGLFDPAMGALCAFPDGKAPQERGRADERGREERDEGFHVGA